jgi:hypothetical protein
LHAAGASSTATIISHTSKLERFMSRAPFAAEILKTC